MAGNNAIQILRANSATIANSSETLLDGQLLYNTDKNYLTCGGGGNNKPVNSLPIVCQELAYYQGDADTISANTGLVHRIGPNKLVNKLEIYSNSSISLTGNSVNIFATGNTSVVIDSSGMVLKQITSSSGAAPNYVTRYTANTYGTFGANVRGLLVAKSFVKANPSGGAPIEVGSNIEAYTPVAKNTVIVFDPDNGGVIGKSLYEESLSLTTSPMGMNTIGVSCNFNCITFTYLSNIIGSGLQTQVLANFLYSQGYSSTSCHLNVSGTYINSTGTTFNVKYIYASNTTSVYCALDNGSTIMSNVYSPQIRVINWRRIT